MNVCPRPDELKQLILQGIEINQVFVWKRLGQAVLSVSAGPAVEERCGLCYSEARCLLHPLGEGAAHLRSRVRVWVGEVLQSLWKKVREGKRRHELDLGLRTSWFLSLCGKLVVLMCLFEESWEGTCSIWRQQQS